MKIWLKILLGVLGIIPIIILNPFGKCSSVFQLIYSVSLGLVYYGVLLIVLIFYILRRKKNEGQKIKPILFHGISMIFIHVLVFAVFEGTFREKPIQSFLSEIDKDTHHRFHISLYENGDYKLKREHQFGECHEYGTYNIKNDTIKFNENVIDFSFNRMCSKYEIVSSNILPCTKNDTVEYLIFKEVE